MESYEESGVETYCGLCDKVLDPPYEFFKVFSAQGGLDLALCVLCKARVGRVEEIISCRGIAWGCNSEVGLQWMKDSGAWGYMTSSGSALEDYLKLDISDEDLEMISKDVNLGRTDPETFEWEYCEIIKRIVKENYREDIFKVLKAYCGKNPGIGYCQGMSYICMWLLLFLTPDYTFYMFSYLIEKILLPDFYSNSNHGNSLNGFYIESSTISGFLPKCIPEFSEACMPPESFSDFFSLQLLIQVFVNAIDFESCIFLWTKLMSEGNIALIRGVVALASVSKAEIVQGQHPLSISKALPQKKINQEIQAEYTRLEEFITQVRVQRLRSKARQFRARQWQKCEKLALRKLEKVSNFKSAEILELSQIFKQMIQVTEEIEIDGKRSVRFTVKLPDCMRDSLEGHNYEAGIRKEQFLEIVENFNPRLQHCAELIFDRFDEDKSGLLDFREFMICLSVMCKGDIEEKLKICFDMYDDDRSGFLQPDEMEELISGITRPYRESQGCIGIDIEEIQMKMRMLCEKSEDKVCFRDFVLAVKSDPMLHDCFSDYLHSCSSPTETLQKTSTIQRIQSSSSIPSPAPPQADSIGNDRCNCSLL